MEVISRISQSRLPPADDAEELATQKDILEASKAIKEHLYSVFTKDIGAAVEARVRELGQDVDSKVKSLNAGRVTDFGALRKEMQDSLDAIGRAYHQKFMEVRDELVTTARLSSDDAAIIAGRVTKSLGEGYDKSLSELSKRLESVAERADYNAKALHNQMTKELDGKIDQLKKSYEAGVSQVKTLLELLRENPAVINVQASPVAVQNTLPPPEIHVNVPEQPTPVVNVTPELKAADVVVNVPATPPRKKTFLYDEMGRPLEVREEDIKE